MALVLGLLEIIGFCQIPNPTQHEVKLFNNIMLLSYTVLRNFRGVLLLLLFNIKCKCCKKAPIETVQ